MIHNLKGKKSSILIHTFQKLPDTFVMYKEYEDNHNLSLLNEWCLTYNENMILKNTGSISSTNII